MAAAPEVLFRVAVKWVATPVVGYALHDNRLGALQLSSRMIALRDDDENYASGACQVDMASDPATGGVTTHDIIALFLDRGALVGSASVPLPGGLDHWGLAHVNRLVGLGVLSEKPNEFGEAMYQMRRTMIQCRASTALRSPSWVARQSSTKDLAQQSKLGIWLEL